MVGFNLSTVAQNCSDYSVVESPSPWINSGTQEHQNGYHIWEVDPTGSCTYSGGSAQYSGPTPCSVDAEAASTLNTGNTYDTGTLTTTLYSHYGTFNQISGSATANNGASAAAGTEGAYAVRSCLTSSCSDTITFSGSGSAGPVNGGVSVTFNPTPLWSDQHNYTNNCAGVTLPQLQMTSSCPSPTSPYPGQSTNNGYYTWDDQSCQWVWVNCQPNINCSGSPIVVDTQHTGFAFTDPTKGQYVLFDLAGDGNLKKVSWPKPGSGNAWLVYDRDGDGVIKDGSELFGNFTPHSNFTDPNLSWTDRNGFIALGWYDQPAQGGNGDDIIDKNDPIWGKLRLWIDTHCYEQPDVPCQSLPSELHTLESFGINSISLIYQYDPNNKDAIGNWFKFYAYLNPDISSMPVGSDGKHRNPNTGYGCCSDHQKSSNDGRRAYDVFLKTVD